MNNDSVEPIAAGPQDPNDLSMDQFSEMMGDSVAPQATQQAETPPQEEPVTTEPAVTEPAVEAPAQDNVASEEAPGTEAASTEEAATPEAGGSSEDTATTPATNYDEYAQEISGGRYNTDEELRSANLTEQLAELEDLRSEVGTFRDQAEQSPFASEEVSHLNQMVKDGASQREINDFMWLQGLDTKEMAYIDILASEMMMKQKVTPDEAYAYLNRKYSQGEDYDEDAQKYGSMEMKIEGSAARERLESQKVDRTLPDIEAQNAETARLDEERMEAWDDSLDAIGQEAAKEAFSFDFGTDEDPDFKFNWEIKPEELKPLMDNAFENLGASGLGINEGNSRSQAKDAIIGEYLTKDGGKNLKLIVQSAVTDVRSRLQTKHHKDIHNPSAANLTDTQTPAPTGEKVVDREEAILDRILASG